MLSEVLTSKYLQYKSDTDAVASWLVNTANHHGLNETGDTLNHDGKPKPPVSQRLKGKARMAARQSQKASSETSAEPIKRKHKITSKEFKLLSEKIAARTPPIEVPRYIFAALHRAIAARRQFNTSGVYDQSDTPNADGHAYFVEVLEYVREILIPLKSTKQPESRRPGPPRENKEEASANMFESLEVEEPSSEFDSAPIAPRTGTASRLECETGSIDDPCEAMFRFCLLLADANAFIEFIQETWVSYRDGAIDLVTAAITTNTAIDLVRRMEDEVKPMLDHHPSLRDPLEVLYLARCKTMGVDPNYREQPDDPFNLEVYEATKDLFMTASKALETIPNTHRIDGEPTQIASFRIRYDPQSDRSKKSAREKFQEDHRVLMEVMPEMGFLAFMPVPSMDEFTRTMKVAFNDLELPFRLIFGVQVFLEIHHVLRANVGQAFADLQQSARYMVNSMTISREFHRGSKSDNWTSDVEDFLTEIQKEMKVWCQFDALKGASLQQYFPRKPFHLMRSHPLFCGVLQYRFKIFFQQLGIALAGAWGSILYTLHLYNALRQEKLLQSSWWDMEVVHGMQSECWVGGPPKHPEDYPKRFVLSMGLSLTSFAKNRRCERYSLARGNAKGMVPQAPVARMFLDRFCEEPTQWDLTEGDLRQIVAQAERTSIVAAENPGQGPTDASFMMASENHDFPPGAGTSLSALGLLSKLRCALHGEAAELTWDYFLMHRQCWRLLRSVKAACEDRLRAIQDISCLDKESELSYVVGLIFLDLDNSMKMNAGDNRRAGRSPSPSMVSAAKVFQEMLDSGAGSIVTSQLMENPGISLKRQPDIEPEAEAVEPDRGEGRESSLDNMCVVSNTDEVAEADEGQNEKEEQSSPVSPSLWSSWGAQCASARRALGYLFGNEWVQEF